MTAKDKAIELEAKIQKEIWALQMLDYATPSVTDNLAIMQKELKEVKEEIEKEIVDSLMVEFYEEAKTRNK